VEAADRTADSQLIRECRATVPLRLGAYLNVKYRQPVWNVVFQTKLDLFSNCLHNPGRNIDVNWEPYSFKVNKFISSSIAAPSCTTTTYWRCPSTRTRDGCRMGGAAAFSSKNARLSG
jgi:hypothetical protein